MYVLDKTLYCLQILTKIILTEFHDTDIGTQSKHVLLKIFVYLSSCKKNFITSKLEMRCSVNLIFVLIYNGSYRNNTCIFFIFQFMDSGLSGRLGPNVLQLVEMVSKRGHGPVRARPPWTAVRTVNHWAVTRSSKPLSGLFVLETQLVQVDFLTYWINETFNKKINFWQLFTI